MPFSLKGKLTEAGCILEVPYEGEIEVGDPDW